MCFAPYLIHRAAPGTRKQKIGLYCNFFAIRGCRMVPPSQIAAQKRSSPFMHRLAFALSERKRIPNRKKLQKCPIFCLCNGRITETRQIRNKYLASAELGAREPDGSQAESQEGDGAIDLWRHSSAAVPHIWGCRLSRASVKQRPNSAHGAK